MPPRDERNTSLIDYGEAANNLIVIIKKELEDVQNKVLIENSNLSQLKQRQIEMANAFESWKKAETSKFTNEMNKVRNDILAKQNEINLHVQQQGRITTDLQTQQQKFEGLHAERIKIKEDMVKIEGQKIQVQDSIKEAERIKADALSNRNEISAMHQQALEIQEKNKQENIRLVNMNDGLEKTRKEIDEKVKSFSELKEFVEPKLRAIQEQTEALEEAKEKNQKVIDDLNRKVNEEKILLQSVLDKKSELDKAEKLLASKQEDFNRQQILSKG